MVHSLPLRDYVNLKKKASSRLVGLFLNFSWNTLGTRGEERSKIICHTNCLLEQCLGNQCQTLEGKEAVRD